MLPMQKIYTDLLKAKTEHKKKFAVLIDPDKIKTANVDQLVELANMAKVDYFFLGGSLVINNITNYCIKTIKQNSDTPIILFPGSSMQLTDKADAVLFLSLISGRNPDLLIGKHVESAPFIKKDWSVFLQRSISKLNRTFPKSNKIKSIKRT